MIQFWLILKRIVPKIRECTIFIRVILDEKILIDRAIWILQRESDFCWSQHKFCWHKQGVKIMDKKWKVHIKKYFPTNFYAFSTTTSEVNRGRGSNLPPPVNEGLLMVLGQLPPRKIASNPKTSPNPNPNPNQKAISLRGNFLVVSQP